MKAPILILAIAVFGTASFAATADSTFHTSNDESGSMVHVVPGTLTKAQRAEIDRGEVNAADTNWAYRGDETGWELKPHSYDFRAGRLVHTDRIPHDAKPASDNTADSELYRYLDRG